MVQEFIKRIKEMPERNQGARLEIFHGLGRLLKALKSILR